MMILCIYDHMILFQLSGFMFSRDCKIRASWPNLRKKPTPSWNDTLTSIIGLVMIRGSHQSPRSTLSPISMKSGAHKWSPRTAALARSTAMVISANIPPLYPPAIFSGDISARSIRTHRRRRSRTELRHHSRPPSRVLDDDIGEFQIDSDLLMNPRRTKNWGAKEMIGGQ